MNRARRAVGGDLSPHPDVSREQDYLDHAYACLERMRALTGRLTAADGGADWVDSEILRAELGERLHSLQETAGPLCFGSIDEERGVRRYIGRRHVKDEDERPVVIDWRAAVAAPFYRATVMDALGLATRRRFLFEERALTDIYEEDFSNPDSVAAVHGGVPDPLLAELSRTRTGAMRDIVATIAAEQDEIIRRPASCLVVVQGGPGTGKTAVGLHRAAYLLYEHRARLEREQVLVVGPNDTYLRYISTVLPSLGETSVRQTTVEGLFGARYRVTRTDPPDLAALKGEVRMAELVRRACLAKLGDPPQDIEVPLGRDVLRIPAAAVSDARAASLRESRALKVGRALFTERLERLVVAAYEDRHHGAVADDFVLEGVRASRGLRSGRDRAWPSITPAAVVAWVLARGSLPRAWSEGLLSERETERVRRAGRRTAERSWSRADLALLDEAETLISGPPVVYGHVIIDEAQDLSAMELRMLGRRAAAGSATLLGDLAQATGAGAQESWTEAIAHMGVDAPVELFELHVGYRVPKPIIDFANRLLPRAAPNVPPPRAIRVAGAEPRVIEVDELVAGVIAESFELADRWPTVGVVAPATLHDELLRAYERRDPDRSRWRAGEVTTGIALLPPPLAKGLEFDAVVVVEPAEVMDAERHGARMLYVALTRSVQELVVIHRRPLPAELVA